jgi:CheY-like chemotaxis protein
MENKNKTILIVEDDATLLQAMKLALTQLQYQVQEAVDGPEGLQKSLDLHPDLILLDLKLPLLSGLEVLKQLRKDPWGKTAKVIVLTNNGKSDSIAEALELNVIDYLVKVDWSLENLMKKIGENV